MARLLALGCAGRLPPPLGGLSFRPQRGASLVGPRREQCREQREGAQVGAICVGSREPSFPSPGARLKPVTPSFSDAALCPGQGEILKRQKTTPFDGYQVRPAKTPGPFRPMSLWSYPLGAGLDGRLVTHLSQPQFPQSKGLFVSGAEAAGPSSGERSCGCNADDSEKNTCGSTAAAMPLPRVGPGAEPVLRAGSAAACAARGPPSAGSQEGEGLGPQHPARLPAQMSGGLSPWHQPDPSCRKRGDS